MTEKKNGAAARAAAPAPRETPVLRRWRLIRAAEEAVPDGWEDVHELYLYGQGARITRNHLTGDQVATGVALALSDGATAAMEHGELVVRCPDGSTWVYVPHGQPPVLWWVEPFGCAWCGESKSSHGQSWASHLGAMHRWVRPGNEQIKARMKARRARRSST